MLNYFFEKSLSLIFNIFRYNYYKKKYKLPKDFRFNGYFIKIYGDGKIQVGDNSYISFFSHITMGKDTKVIIGNNVSIAHNVRIYTISIDTTEYILNKIKKDKIGNVYIGNNVLIGTNVYINPGVKIGDNVVIGANSVVTKNIPSNCIVAGMPAKVVKTYDVKEKNND
ncbi:acyltransferase [Arcobacter roscoffensis]|uniref:Acyltransferase n=1 Tax=Arcobacter roscoffensis TaxID=2961520 RepID=A0ABY5E9E7_9BACT|nr:acyltransferase [Arcobacter roscoffensis]UTJ07343.1 acyltransferase [Arcobacter roscoffensis]